MGARRVFTATSLAAVALVAQSVGALAAITPPPTPADLAVTITGPASAAAGTNITYSITVTNYGPGTANGVIFNIEPLPANTTYVSPPTLTSPWAPSPSIPAGRVYTWTWVVKINSPLPVGTTMITKTLTITSTTPDPNLLNNTSTANTMVTGATRQLNGHGIDAGAVEGASFSGPVATFTDSKPTASPADYTAVVINWGDGASSPGTVVASGSGFAVRGTHTYLEEGSYPISTALAFPGGTATFTSSRGNVADAALHAQGVALPATRLTSFAGTVATFTDDDPGGAVSDYSGTTINWGDGTTSAGAVAAQGTGFKVSGSHTFGQGSFTIRTTIRDAGGAWTVATSTITVDLTPPVTTATVNGTFKNGWWKAVNPATLTLAATDNLTGVAATYYTLNGGATKVYTGPVTLSTGLYVIRYWSVDKVGNVEAAHTILIKVKRHTRGECEDDCDDVGDHGER